MQTKDRMENISQVANVLLSCFSILALIYLWFWQFRQTRIDIFRQNIFILRDELFEFAANGGIGFDHPAYMMLRTMMNGYLRFAHKITLSQFLISTTLTRLFNREYPYQVFEDEWNQALCNLDETTRNKMKLFEERASMKLFNFVFLSSLTKKFFAVFPLAVAVAYFTLTRSKREKFRIAIKVKSRRSEQSPMHDLAYNYSTRSPKVVASIESFNAGAYTYGKKSSPVAV